MIDYSIFVIDDEQTVLDGITMALESDFDVKGFSTAEAAIEELSNNTPDLVLLDIGLPGMSGIEALKIIKDIHPEILVIMITAFDEVDKVVATMKLGAYDYVVKPLQMEGLEVTIRNCLDTIRLRKEVLSLQKRYLRDQIPCFIGESNAIQDVMEFIESVAKSPDTPILLMGGSGTGKELLSSTIHHRSPNFRGQLVTVNCAAIPKDLIETELFGYEKGAFSGASESGKKGLLEEAENGTLFLDEVGDLSLEAQAKLLRFLDKGEFYRIGGTKILRVKTRVVSATNKDLPGMIQKNLFREDLLFRLGVIKVSIPSLNERQEDILPLTKHFLIEFSRKFGKKFSRISGEAKKALIAHDWKGNVRELKNMVERAVLTGPGPELRTGDLGLEQDKGVVALENSRGEREFPPLPPGGIDLTSAKNSMEIHYIEEAMKLSKGNESKAAKLLNINHHTFRYRRKKLT